MTTFILWQRRKKYLIKNKHRYHDINNISSMQGSIEDSTIKLIALLLWEHRIFCFSRPFLNIARKIVDELCNNFDPTNIKFNFITGCPKILYAK